MSDIYQQKARKYKLKYLKLKKRLYWRRCFIDQH